METLDETTTVIDLEQLVNGDDCACQANHSFPTTTVCTVTVVARKFVCDRPAFNICQASYDWNMEAMIRNGACSGCHRHTSVCWTIIPI